MIYIKFNDETTKMPITKVTRLSDNVVCFTGAKENISGFKTYIDEEEVGDFSDYNTIYRVVEDDVYFSNDGSIYNNPKATITVNFDDVKEAPNSVKVILNTKEEVIITSPWIKEIEYVEGEYPYIESVDDVKNYDKSFGGLTVTYTFITEKERTLREISRLVSELSNTDYKIIKCFEYQLAGLEVPYDITELHATRQALRDKINELEAN